MRYVQLFDSSTIKEGKEGKERRRKEKGKGWKKEKNNLHGDSATSLYASPSDAHFRHGSASPRGNSARLLCSLRGTANRPEDLLPANKRLPGSSLSHVHMSLTSSFRSFLDDPDYLEGNQRKGMSTVVPPLLVPRSVPVKTNTLRHDS